MAKTKTLFTLRYRIRNFDAWIYFKFMDFLADHNLFGRKWLKSPQENTEEWLKYTKTKERKIEEIDELVKFCKELKFRLEECNETG